MSILEWWHVECPGCEKVTAVEPDDGATFLFFLCDHCGFEGDVYLTPEIRASLAESLSPKEVEA